MHESAADVGREPQHNLGLFSQRTRNKQNLSLSPPTAFITLAVSFRSHIGVIDDEVE